MQTAENPIDNQVKRKVGRPSKYTPELISKAWAYLDNWQSYGHKIPSVSGLANVLDTTRERLHVWKGDKNKREFCNILNKLMSLQESLLLDNGLDGTFNSTITKLVLSKHGYQDNPVNNQGSSGIQVTINRGSVVLQSEGQTLAIDTAETASQPRHATIDHDPIG